MKRVSPEDPRVEVSFECVYVGTRELSTDVRPRPDFADYCDSLVTSAVVAAAVDISGRLAL